jgi:membrane-bound ClpP family serine protease
LILMEWLTVIILILVGTFLVVGEIVFIPGVIVAGTIGVVFNIIGIVLGYKYFDSTIGTGILIATILLNILSLVYVFRSKSWESFSLKDESEGKAQKDYLSELNVGDKGMTISTLKPVGKAIFGELEVEVSSFGGYIAENIKVEISQISSNKILVKELI